MSIAACYDDFVEMFGVVEKAAHEKGVEGATERKLRQMTLAEVGGLLGLQQAGVIRAMRDAGISHRARLDFTEVLQLRTALAGEGGDTRYVPRRREALGERLATVVFANYKGGSGKTTASIHFAQYMARRGHRVLMVDLDSQASATNQFGVDYGSGGDDEGRGFLSWTQARDARILVSAASLCVRTHWPTIDLVPAGPFLFEAEDALAARARSGKLEEVAYFDELGAFLEEVAPAYDVVVVDVRPDVNFLMSTALHAASRVVIPMKPMAVDLSSTRAFFQHLSGYVRQYEAAFDRPFGSAGARLLVTQYTPTDRSQATMVALMRELLGDLLYPGEFLNSPVVGTASFRHETLYEYESTTDRTAYSRVIGSVNAVCGAIEEDVSSFWGRPPQGGNKTGRAP